MKFSAILLLYLMLPLWILAQNPAKKAWAGRNMGNIKIDGRLDEKSWESATPLTELTQYIPVFNVAPSYQTEVRILFDDEAVYLGARMFDPHPDSILRQLGNRDDDNLTNARACYESAKAVNPGFTQARVLLGVTLLSLGEPDAATAEWKEVLSLEPDNRSAKVYLRMIEAQRTTRPSSRSGAFKKKPEEPLS